MDKPILVIDSDGTLIASWRPFPSSYITKIKPDGTRYTAGVKLIYPIAVNKTLLRLIHRAKVAGYTIVLFTNNTNLPTYNMNGKELGLFLDNAYEEIKKEYKALTDITLEGPIQKTNHLGGSLFDYVITGNDPIRHGDKYTKNLAVLRRIIPGGDNKTFSRRIFMIDDQVPTQEMAMEIPFGQYVQIPCFEQDKHGKSSFSSSIHSVLEPFLAAHPELGHARSSRSRSRRGSRRGRDSRRTRGRSRSH
jgi:hypothetical protein